VDDDEATRPQPPAGDRPRDPRLDAETTQFPRPTGATGSNAPGAPAGPAGPNAPTGSAAETARFPLPGPDETSVLPPATGASGPARWSGRAGVPPASPRGAVPQEPAWIPDQQPRTWWAPILIIVAILVLLVLIGLGLWLATHGQPAPTPSPSPTAAASSASPSPSARPSPSATSSPPVATVSVPSVTGVMLTDAQQILQSQNLKWKVVTAVSDQPAGSVIRTDPAAGTAVPAGSTVTLYVATAPATSASPTPSPSASTTR
jgi:PASTA domain-containing protein